MRSRCSLILDAHLEHKKRLAIRVRAAVLESENGARPEQDWNETVTVTHVLSLSEPVRHGSPVDDRCAYCAGAVLCHGAATDASSGTGRLQPPVMNLRHGAHLHALLSLLALPLMSCHQGAQKRACERVGVALVECSCVCRCEGAMRVCPNWDQRSPCSGCIHSKYGVRGHAWTLV